MNNLPHYREVALVYDDTDFNAILRLALCKIRSELCPKT